MSRLLLGALRWVLRNMLNLVLILAVLLGCKWLQVKWDEAATAAEQLEQLQAERPTIGNELLKSAKALEQQLRFDLAIDAGAKKLQNTVEAGIKTRQAERDQTKKASPIAVKLPTTREFKRVVVLDMELSMLEQARVQAQSLANFAGDVAAGKGQIDALRWNKYRADVRVYENKLEHWEIGKDHPVAIHIPSLWPYQRLQVLAAELPDLQKQAIDAQVRIDSLAFTVGLTERKLTETRATFLTGHASVEQAMATIDAMIERLRLEVGEGFWSSVRSQLLLAGGVLASIILAPVGIKALLYFVVAPWASRQKPICVLPDTGAPLDKPGHPVRMVSSGVSLSILLEEDEELLLHSNYVQSASVASGKSIAWVLSWSYILTSLAAGMYALTRILPYRSEPTVVSSSQDASVEVALIEVPEGSAIIFHPHYLVGVVQKHDKPIRITSHWRLGHLHSWLTLQLRYLVFHGAARLIVKGCRGVRLESSGSGRLVNQAATLGFSANLQYSVTRCETFVSYWRGEQELFNDKFSGDSGFYIYEEMPSRTGTSGITGRGLEGLADSALKVFGI
jgi:hypothetical protein